MSHFSWPRAILPFACALLLGAVAFASLWQPGLVRAGPLSQTDSTATPTPTPSPTPSPPDAELAAAFARQGKFEAATGAYLAVIEQGSKEERLAARLALARVLLDDGQTAAAVRHLDTLLLEAPLGFDVRDAQYLLAEALAVRADWEGALPLYDAYVEAGGGASVYARQGRAEALARLGRGPEAISEAEELLAVGLPQSVRLGFILTVAQALEVSDPEDALAWYDRLREESGAPADQALALWRSARIQRALGNGVPQIDAWITIIQRFPETPTAQAIVDEPPSMFVVVDSFYTGLVYFRAGRTQEAREAFKGSLAANENKGARSLAARSAYYLAVLDEGAGSTDAAIDGYARVPELDDTIELADDALWWRGRLLEQERRLGAAAVSYVRLLSEYETSAWASEASFRLGLLDYDRGRYEDAAQAFAAIADGAREEERQRALLWQGKALDAAGERAAADAIWQTLREKAPNDYHGLRAAVLLGEAGGSLKDAGLEEAAGPDWAAIEAWLVDSGIGDPAVAAERLLYNRHWALGQELLALGMRRRAGAELGLLLEEAGGDARALYQLARFSRSVGMFDVSSRAATRLWRAVPEQAAVDAPLDLWRVAYPTPFVGVLREAADGAEVPDVLLLALIRQESFFDPLAGSPAGALGLSQVIPSTGAAIARDLDLADFETEDLYRPSVSLRFGAHYLREQLDTFDGNVYQALAAYNAGPGNALRWRSAAGDDVDRFVAEIEFSQTRAYVELVADNLARYRQLYQELDAPALPRD